MTEPSEKSPEMEEFLEKVFGRTSAIKTDKCVLCGKPAVEFKDEISKREYTISGMCQECQDKVF